MHTLFNSNKINTEMKHISVYNTENLQHIIKDLPLYSIPHLSFTITGFPVKLFKKGLGLTGIVCKT